MNFTKTLIISAVVSFAIGITMLNLPAYWFSLDYWFPSHTLGAAFTTIATTNQLSNFPTTYNNNLNVTANTTTPDTWSGLQQFQGQASSTLFSCYGPCYFGATATSSFSTAGALTLITPLTVANGGTGSTTLSSNQILLGNGTATTSVVSGWGLTNQVLGSNGGTAAPTWRTFAVDLTSNYAWTGVHTISASTTGQLGLSTTTLSTALGVQGNAYISGTTTTGNLVLASSTLSNTNGTNIQYPAGLGTVQSVLSYTRNGNVNASDNGTSATTSLLTVRLPASTFKTNSIIKIDSLGTATGGSQACYWGIDFGGGASTSTISYQQPATVGAIYANETTMFIQSSTQEYSSSITGGSVSVPVGSYASSSTFSISSPLYLDFQVRDANNNSTCTLQSYGITIEGN